MRNIEMKKRTAGGYYAFVEVNDHTMCFTLKPRSGATKAVSYWVASTDRDTKASGHTRTEAIEALAAVLEAN